MEREIGVVILKTITQGGLAGGCPICGKLCGKLLRRRGLGGKLLGDCGVEKFD